MSLNNVEIETVLLNQVTAAAAGNTNRALISDINGIPLETIDELFVFMDFKAVLTGGVFDLFLQRALVADPVLATDAHWTDYAHFLQVPAGTLKKVIGSFPSLNAPSAAVTTDAFRDVENGALVADASLASHWGKVLRVREVVGAGASAAGTYDLIFHVYRKKLFS